MIPSLDSVLAIGFIVAGVSYAVAQFFSGRRKGLAEALVTQGEELKISVARCKRLEEELFKQTQTLAECKAEAVTMRSLLVGGRDLSDNVEQIAKDAVKTLERFAREEHEKTRALIREIEGIS